MFDVVVVGGGAAGCVVAASLARSASRSVLLLEAGPDRRRDTPAELRDGWSIACDGFDWGYRSDPNQDGAVQNLWRKRLLGGTSWLTRFSPRGSPGDYDAWEELGNPGWRFEDVLPYLTRIEADTDFGLEPWHGDHGPIPSTRYIDYAFTDIVAAGVEALAATGFPVVEDHNRPGAVGVGRMPMSSRDGARVTTVDAYLPLDRTPSNLTIRSNALVDAVVLDRDAANGVRLVDGSVVEAGWVVLCGGTYGSPAILMRSGIGCAAHLASLGIAVAANLAGVGANLGDHPAFTLELGYGGPHRAAPALHAIATFRSSDRGEAEPPDLMLWLADPVDDTPIFEIDVVLLKPRARGTVRLASPDPEGPLQIELPRLDESADVPRLAEGCRRALAAARLPAFRRWLSGDVPRDPEAGELRASIRSQCYSVPHVVGTCAMGPAPDHGAVVDALGRVHGIDRLSVADASVIPDVPSGFTHVPTIMLAERLSEHIAANL